MRKQRSPKLELRRESLHALEAAHGAATDISFVVTGCHTRTPTCNPDVTLVITTCRNG